MIDLEVLGHDGQCAAIGHRVTRVHSEVEENLLHLSSVSTHGLQITPAERDQAYVLAERVSQQRLDLTDDVIDVKNLEVSHLSAGKGKQLVRQAGGTLRGRISPTLGREMPELKYLRPG